MPEESYRVLFVITDLILPLIVGYILQKCALMQDKTANFIIKFNVILVYSLQTLLAFWVLPLTFDCIYLIPIGFFVVIFPGIVAAYTFAKRHREILDHGAYIMSAMLSNIGTLGGVCAFILYSESGFAYTQIIASCQTVLLVLLCFPLAQYYRDKYDSHGKKRTYNLKELLKKFISLNQMSVVGIALGLMLNFYAVPRPSYLSPVFSFLVHFGAWTALVPVGYLISFKRTASYYGKVWDLCIIRFVIVPLAILIICKLLFDSAVLKNTLLVSALAPTAINAVIASRLYKLNVDLALASFIMTTAIYLIVIFPVFFFFVA